MQTQEQRNQEEMEIEESLKKIRALIVENVNREYYSLTELAKMAMREKLTTRSILTLRQWLDNTKETILFELIKMDRYEYRKADDRIYYIK